MRTTTVTIDGETIYIDHWSAAMSRLINRKSKSLDFTDFLSFIGTCKTEEECEAVKKIFLSNMRYRKADIKKDREYKNMTNQEYMLAQYEKDNS
tara:strand:- start:266 stop:547 length:282 start_codon:yes stop_codon:yes gene_type:complete